jgi:hypothetical protein
MPRLESEIPLLRSKVEGRLFTVNTVAVKEREPHFSETSVHTRATRRNIPEDGILHSQRRESPKSYIALTDWAL